MLFNNKKIRGATFALMCWINDTVSWFVSKKGKRLNKDRNASWIPVAVFPDFVMCILAMSPKIKENTLICSASLIREWKKNQKL